jgi:hypothetical protein
MPTPCRVWHLHQARCLMCDWAGEITSDPADAAYDAYLHRRTLDHQARLATRHAARMAERRKRFDPT